MLRTKILESIDPRLVGEVTKRMDVHMKAECLNNIGEEQRLLVVGLFSRERRAEALMRLRYWQTLEKYNWPAKILPLFVMTRKIPAHYPPEMIVLIAPLLDLTSTRTTPIFHGGR
jgi:hypothetical protein